LSLRALAWALAIAALASLLPAARPAAAQEPPRLDADTWILIDTSDGATLAAHRPDAEHAIASTTKLMTAYLALHNLPLDAELTAPPYHPLVGESLLGLRTGDRISVEDLLYGLLLESGNDAAVALADGVSGSETAFVERMNAAAAQLGLDHTHYANPIGLDEPGNYSTARDLTILAERLLRDPRFRRIVDTPEATVETGGRTIHIEDRNTLVARVPWVNGVKTGFTNEAGYVLVGSGTRNGVTMVSAVLGTPSEAARDAETLRLLRYGLSLYREQTPVRPGERLASSAISYRDRRLSLVAAHPVRLTVRRDQRVATRVVRTRREVDEARRGQRLGLAVVKVDGEREARVPLVAAATVSGPTLIDRVDSALPGGRTMAWGLLGLAALALLLMVIGIAAAIRRRRSAPV
jgi:serine-type D-Ala-D-Ala carboxypeptidase (penicillin-binding protein 5/6)